MTLKMPEKAMSAERTGKHHDKLCIDFGKTPIEKINSMEEREKYRYISISLILQVAHRLF